jgi:hypothetical protein
MTSLNRIIRAILTAAMAALVVVVPASPAAGGTLTVRCSETLKSEDVTNGGVAGTGRCTLTGAISDRGAATDYRKVAGSTARIRRVVRGTKGTIVFLLTIDLSTGSEPWTIASGSKVYAGLRGSGREVVDRFDASPAVFVMKGTVTR